MGPRAWLRLIHSYSVGHTAAALPTLHLVGPPAPHANASRSISDRLSLALSNDVSVSAPSESNGRPSDPPETASVLSSLPRTRPQRSTARRTAARKAMTTPGARAAAQPRKPKPARKAPAKPHTRSAPRRAAAAAPDAEPVPMQGFESESDRARGPVHPPGAAELVASAAEVLGELAKSGLSTGERLLKDVLARLPLS
jgi:hypothetical protein